MSILAIDNNTKTYEKIVKTIDEKRIDFVVIEYGKIDIGLIKKILSLDLEMDFLHYELDQKDRMLNIMLKKMIDLAYKRFNSRMSIP
ncbi:MAG: hypothetical protein ACUVWP_05965 [bacterium]